VGTEEKLPAEAAKEPGTQKMPSGGELNCCPTV